VWRTAHPEIDVKVAVERALNVSTAGSIYMQPFIDKAIQQVHLRYLGVTSALQRRPGSGLAAYVNRRAGSSTGQWVADTGTISDTAVTPTQVPFQFKTIANKLRITRAMMSTAASYADILAQEILGVMGDTSETYEAGLVYGDVAVSANQFDGLVTQIQAFSAQIILQTSTTTGDALTLDKLDETCDAVRGSNKLIFANLKMRRMLNGLLQANQQFVGQTEIDGGFRVMTYNGFPVITSTGIENDWTFNGTKITAYGSSTTSAIIVVDADTVVIRERQAMTVQPLAQVSSQYQEVDMYSDTVLTVEQQYSGAILVGLDAS
jgi:hypothetical protein